MYVLFWKAIQHVQPEYFSKKTACLTREGRKVPIWNGRWSLRSGSVVGEKSIKRGETVKEQRKEKMKKKNITSRAVDSFSVSFALRKPFDSPPPPPSATNALPLPLLYLSFWSDLDWFCYSVLTFRQNSKTSPKRFKTTPKFVTFKLLIYSNVPKCILVPLQVSTCWGLIPRGGTPYNGLYGEAPPEMGTFLRLQGQGYERVGILLVEVYERVGVISVGEKRVQKGQ